MKVNLAALSLVTNPRSGTMCDVDYSYDWLSQSDGHHLDLDGRGSSSR